MAGVKGHSGRRRPGSGPKRKAQLLLLHTMIDSYLDSPDWSSMVLINQTVKSFSHGNSRLDLSGLKNFE
jgi:hypothetical protein